MDRPPSVVGVCGSLRAESTTRTALTYALAAAKREGATVELVDLREYDLPLYDADDRDVGNAPRLRETIREADAVALGTPIYHGTIASPLKTALDYCGFDEFEDTLVGVLATAGGSYPTPALLHLRVAARWLRAWTLPHQVAIPQAADAVEDGEIVDEEILDRTETLGRDLARYAGVPSYPEVVSTPEPTADD